MQKLLPSGRVIFAVGIAALGVLCLLSQDFIVGRPPAWPAGISVNPFWAYLWGGALILSAVALFFSKKPAWAALVIAALILLLSVSRHLSNSMSDWLNTLKTLALLGGSLIVAASYLRTQPALTPRLKVGKSGVQKLILAGSVLLAVFFIGSGYAHFKFADFVENFIPAYIPFRAFWAYFCGICLLAGGVGILIPQTRFRAALLSAIMLSGWFLLLHIPRFLDNTSDASERLGLCESFTFAGIFFVLAGVVPRRGK